MIKRRQAGDQYEAQMMAVLRSQFERQRSQAIAHLDPSAIGKSYSKKSWLDDLLDWVAATDDLAQALKPLVFTILSTTGQDAMQEVGRQPSTYDPFSPALRDYFQNRPVKIAQDVNDETAKQLRASLSQGVAAGESQTQLRARVEAVFGSASTMRADRIARTEVTRAQGYADIQAWSQSGIVTGKEWFTAEDEHVCAFCESLDHTVTGLHETFFDKGDVCRVGDQKLDLSYDDVPSAPLHVNCRCVLLPVRS